MRRAAAIAVAIGFAAVPADAGRPPRRASVRTWGPHLIAGSGGCVEPTTSLDSQPTDPSSDTTPTFTFSSPSSGAITFECQIDGGGYSSCTSPHTTAALGEGSHTFDVRAVCGGALADGSPATYTWTIATPLDWTRFDYAWWADACVVGGFAWSAQVGSMTLNQIGGVPSATSYTCDNSTGSLIASGLGTLEDNGLIMGVTTAGWGNSTSTALNTASGDNMYIRLLYYHTSPGGYKYYFSAADGSDNGWVVYSYDSKIWCWAKGSSGTNYTSVTPAANRWHLLDCEWRAGENKWYMYLDGVLTAGAAGAAGAIGNANAIPSISRWQNYPMGSTQGVLAVGWKKNPDAGTFNHNVDYAKVCSTDGGCAPCPPPSKPPRPSPASSRTGW